MSDLRYTEDHEWISVDGSTGTVGITDHAQQQLGDIVFVELPEVESEFSQGDEVGTIESVKAASEFYAPVSGKIVETNDALGDEPGTINSDAMGKGWLYKIELRNPDELDKLMDEAAYKKHVEAEG